MFMEFNQMNAMFLKPTCLDFFAGSGLVAEGFLAYSILESMTPGSTGYSQIRPRPND